MRRASPDSPNPGAGRYDCGVNSPIVRWAGSVLVAVAALAAIASVAAVLFLNPVWIGFEQERSDVPAITGYSSAEVRQVTGSILSDLVFGPPRFDVAVNGKPVLDQRERGHMVDVRNVFFALGVVAALAWLALIAAAIVSRGGRWFWRAVRGGAIVLAGGVVVVGGAFALFFDQAFETMHELFFPAGTYNFDPRTERLVQLFPTQFWMETSVVLAAAVIVLAVLVALGSGRLAASGGRPERRPPAQAPTEEAS